jgi:hypothetical protein
LQLVRLEQQEQQEPKLVLQQVLVQELSRGRLL